MDGFQNLPKGVGCVAVLIASQPTLLRYGLRQVLADQQPTWKLAEVDTFDAALDHVRHSAPDLVLLDIGLLAAQGPEALRDLRLGPTRIVVLADTNDRTSILRWIGAGAQGYLMKAADKAQVMCALNTVLFGAVFAPSGLTAPPDALPSRALPERLDLGPHELTERQREVLELLLLGHSTKMIARHLDIAVATVKVHLAAIYRLLGAHSRSEVLANARGNYPPSIAEKRPASPVKLVSSIGTDRSSWPIPFRQNAGSQHSLSHDHLLKREPIRGDVARLVKAPLSVLRG